MANVHESQAFYSLTLESASAPTAAVCCNVIPGLKMQDQQIFEARGERVYIRRIHENEERTESWIETVLEHDVFGIIRGVTAFRIPGTTTDQLIVSSDSGRMAMLTYDAEHNQLKRTHLETFGKSGVRRTIPGQYVAADPRGRCLMMASPEKNKIVYIVQRNAEGGINISSPHEANQWASLCFDICALDTGWEHPVFAALEVEYADAEGDASGAMYAAREKQLVYYTVDLGLNHVVKNWSDPVDYSANKVFAVPGGTDGPSGVLVCAEDRIYYKHDKFETLCVGIPRRQGAFDDPNRKRIIVAGCRFLTRARQDFFFLLQTEDGDVFKLTLENIVDESGRKTAQPGTICIKYFDTLPLAREMLLIRKGYIYVMSESGPSKLYHVDSLGDDAEFEPWNNFTSDGVSPDFSDPIEPTYFKPRGLLMLTEMSQVPGLHPLLRTKVDNLTGEDAPQIYGLQGSGNNSVFKTIRHGMSVNDVVASDLGNVPYDKIWTLKQNFTDEYQTYILISSKYGDSTVILGIGDEVESLENTAFLNNRATVVAAQMGDATLVQVHARGVHMILPSGEINEWPAPMHRTITVGAANQRQLLLGLSSGELAFFFMDSSGVLSALEDFPEMSGKVTAIGLAQTPKGRQQARYGVVGCDDRTIRVLSIELDSPLEPRSVQALSDVPSSIEVVEMLDPASNTTVTFVHIGLVSGLYLRAIIDEMTGELSQVRTKFLGPKPVRIFPVEVEGQQCILACSSRPWLGYHHPVSKQYTMTPLITKELEAVSPFVSEQLGGLCGIKGSELRIFVPSRLGGRFIHQDVALEYTPRNFTRNPWFPVYYVIEGDGNTLSKTTTKQLLEQREEQAEDGTDVQSGLARGKGHWASCIQAIDPVTQGQVTSTIYLEDNETALSCACVPFQSRDHEVYLAVGTGQDMSPGREKDGSAGRGGGYLHIYKLVEEGTKMEFVHKTRVDEPVYAMLPFQGKLAVGIGSEVFIYDIGMKAMMRKSRGAAVPNTIVTMEAQGNRIVCGDVRESITYVVYKPKANRMVAFADDVISRWTTTTTMLDYETTAGADKFGNIWILRCPEQASNEADEEGINGFIVNERSYLNGAPYRLNLRAHFYTQDIPTSMQRTALVAGGQDVLFWSGIQGTLGMLVPFVSREDVVFFTQLEQLLRQEDPPIAGRDHLMYRGYYVPVKGVIDGDLCERFMGLNYDGKQKISAELERSVIDIEKKVQEMRTRVAF